ncbi:MAG: phosphoribosylamine--glycine ligase [Candidatus Omnitrophota bacterium]|nr:MAG: phosphoribosylamine--glycine ligase [Candidatus Omnitrophota bacterium]
MRVLVVGSGGREHCLAWKLSQSPLVKKIYCAPGNGGTATIAQNIGIGADDIDALVDFAVKEKIDLTVAGPEAPLVAGIVDKFEAKGLKIFGPAKDLALLEGSKIFAKETMKKFNIPTADFKIFDDAGEAKAYIREKGAPIVVKADGLAAGKGVIVCASIEEAEEAVEAMLVKKQFGAAGEKVIVEDCLEGEEASILIFTDGETIVPLVSSQDHKRVFDNDKGPNTGGMGAYAPAPIVSDELFGKVNSKVCVALIEGLKKEGKTYKGMLYVGLMIKGGEPYVLEFNVRFGDPETQAILPKLKSDLADVMLKTANNDLKNVSLDWDERYCVCVVVASGGYPASYEKGKVITGLERIENIKDVYVFHAGTKLDTEFVTSGGRVLGVVGLGDTIEEAQTKAYSAIKNISFEKMHYRKDIGSKALKFLNEKVK